MLINRWDFIVVIIAMALALFSWMGTQSKKAIREKFREEEGGVVCVR